MNRRPEIMQALSEAWAWLEAQGLIVPHPETGQYGWKVLSRRAKKVENEAEFTRWTVSRMLPKEALQAKLADKVWMAFMRAEFDVAAFQAMKTVEVAVRTASGLTDKLGVDLMRSAFSPKDGPLTDLLADGGEHTARMELFAGAIGSCKDPHSHKDVGLDDPVEAIEIIMLANHLLRIVEACAARYRGLRNPCLWHMIRVLEAQLMFQIQTDSLGQPYLQWSQADGPAGSKRTWIQRKNDDKDWAGTGTYLNVVRIDETRPGSGGNPTDFPIFSELPDEQVLEAFVAAVCAVTSCRLP